ncbi:MAG: hypothetical protein QOG89_1474 [Thermomicrobiales bacterium]|nr:hypothetical protein [Thermomicrobiales bacterium]
MDDAPGLVVDGKGGEGDGESGIGTEPHCDRIVETGHDIGRRSRARLADDLAGTWLEVRFGVGVAGRQLQGVEDALAGAFGCRWPSPSQGAS